MKPIQIIGRKYSMEILGATEEPTSVARLSDSLDVPVATCYRRVNELASVGLLEEQTVDENDDSGSTRYRRTIDAMGIHLSPTPSVFAWTRIRQAAGADPSPLDIPTGNQTGRRARSEPTVGHGPDSTEAVSQQESSSKDA
jgi:hypothetical protein